MPLEADTRNLIDTALTNLGWKLNGKDKNVFFEQPKTEAERKSLGGKRPDYVLYSNESDRPLITWVRDNKVSLKVGNHRIILYL